MPSTVTAPEAWTVLGNGAATQVGARAAGSWPTTKPLATYFVTVCAGPVRLRARRARRHPLGIHARASLRDAPRARGGRDARHHQGELRLLPRAVRDPLPVRGVPPGLRARVQRRRHGEPGLRDVPRHDHLPGRRGARRARCRAPTRSPTRWPTCGSATSSPCAGGTTCGSTSPSPSTCRTAPASTPPSSPTPGSTSTMARKGWGYAAERTPRPTRWPGAAARRASRAAGLRRDLLRQGRGRPAPADRPHRRRRVHRRGVGPPAQHSFGNGTLADFLGAMERASGRSLEAWSRAWLLTAGLDVISVDRESGEVHRAVPQAFPADRPHTLDVAGFAGGEEVFRVPVTLRGDGDGNVQGDGDARRAAARRRRGTAAELVVPNASDLTWATVALDPESLAAVPTALARVPDAQARAVVWIGLLDGVCLGGVDPRVLVRTFESAWPVEDNDSVLSRSTTACSQGSSRPSCHPMSSRRPSRWWPPRQPGCCGPRTPARPGRWWRLAPWPVPARTRRCCGPGPPARTAPRGSTAIPTSAGWPCATWPHGAWSTAVSSRPDVTTTTPCRAGSTPCSRRRRCRRRRPRSGPGPS